MHQPEPVRRDNPQRLRLSAGLPTGRKVFLIVAAPLGMVLILPLFVIGNAFRNFGGDVAWTIGVLFPWLGTAALVVAVACGLLSVVRTGAVLDGTDLVVRRIFSTRRVDLATAQRLRLTNAQSSFQAVALIPRLEAWGDAQGRSAIVHFGQARDGYLPAPEVDALTAAIRSGRRAGLAAEQAEETVRQLALRALPLPGRQPGTWGGTM